MKNIVVKILVSSVIFYHIGLMVSAADIQVFDDGSSITTATYDDGSTMTTTTDTEGSSTVSSTDAPGSPSSRSVTTPTPSTTMKIITTEEVPGAKCTCIAGGNSSSVGPVESSCKNVVTRKYVCEVGVGFSQFQIFFASVIRMVINITILLGVLAVVGLGIAWSLAGGDDVKAKSSLKSWAINIIAGVVILFFFRYILMFLAPWIYN